MAKIFITRHGRLSKYLVLFIIILHPIIVWGQELPPQVTIFNPLNNSFFDGEQIKIEYTVSGTAPNLVRIYLDDDAKPVQLLTGVKLGDNTATVDVPPRDCKISLVAVSDFGESVPAVVNLQRNENVFKPSLYILAVGISNYNDPVLRLHYSAKDASDFTQALMRQAGSLYASVDMKLFTDRTATYENIRDGLDWLQKQTTNKDIAMLYMSGHGANNNNGEFFYLPVGADKERLNATCVNYRDIKATIEAVAGKMLVFIDACHSGNVLGSKAAMSDQVANELSKTEKGAVIFTSSMGNQLSLEKTEWDNGAFTKALVEGLNGKADIYNLQTITVGTLSSYIAKRVKELTEGKQAPTTIIPNSVPDFPIAVVNVNVNMNVTVNVESPMPVTPSVKTKNSDNRQRRFYAMISAGPSLFGKISIGDATGAKATAGMEAASFFNNRFGAGIKLHYSSCDMNIRDKEYQDKMIFLGPAFFSNFGSGRLTFTTCLSIGILDWEVTQTGDIFRKGIRDDWEGGARKAGGFISAGANYMLTHFCGVGFNIQSTVGSLTNAKGVERNPAALGCALGINFRF